MGTFTIVTNFITSITTGGSNTALKLRNTLTQMRDYISATAPLKAVVRKDLAITANSNGDFAISFDVVDPAMVAKLRDPDTAVSFNIYTDSFPFGRSSVGSIEYLDNGYSKSYGNPSIAPSDTYPDGINTDIFRFRFVIDQANIGSFSPLQSRWVLHVIAF